MAMLYPRRRLLLPAASLLSCCPQAWDYGGDRQGLAAEERAEAARRARWTERRLQRKATRRAVLAAAAAAGVAIPSRLRAAPPPGRAIAGPHLDARDFADDNGTPLRGGGDDAAAIRKAIARAVADHGGAASIFLGAGPLNLQSPIEIASNIRLIGDGPNTTIATVAYSSDADIIVAGGNPNSAGIYGVQFRLAAGCSHSNGALLHFVNNHDCAVEDCVTWGGFFRHVHVTGGRGQYINYVRKCEFNALNTAHESVAVLVDGYAQDIWLEDIEMGGNNLGQGGILLKHCAGAQLRNIDIIAMARGGFGIYAEDGHPVVNVFIENLEVDTCAQSGNDVAGALIGMPGTGIVRNIHISDSWFSTNKTAGLIVNGSAQATVEGVHLSNCMAFNNGHHGLWLQGHVQDADVFGCTLGDNGQAKPDTFAGLAIGDAMPVEYVSVVGGRSGSNDRLGAISGSQKYGYLIARKTDHILLANTTAHGNATAALADLSDGRHNRIQPPLD